MPADASLSKSPPERVVPPPGPDSKAFHQMLDVFLKRYQEEAGGNISHVTLIQFWTWSWHRSVGIPFGPIERGRPQ